MVYQGEHSQDILMTSVVSRDQIKLANPNFSSYMRSAILHMDIDICNNVMIYSTWNAVYIAHLNGTDTRKLLGGSCKPLILALN